MRIRISALALTASLSVLGISSAVFACDDGFAAFQTSVYKKVRKDCAKCHDGSRPTAPAFAVTDPFVSYQAISNYMNFAKVEDSLFAIRAGNGHCLTDACDSESGNEMVALAQQWVDDGEKTCLRNGTYFTEEVAIPSNLPIPSEGFMTMSFDLGNVDSALTGTKFQIDIQSYLGPAEGSYGAYRIKAPRFANGKTPLQIKDIKILLNGKYDPVYNAYTVVDKVAGFYPVNLKALPALKSATVNLSGTPLLLLKDGLPNPKLQISFVQIQNGQSPGCLNESKFSQLPVLFKSVNCISCHNSQSTSLSGQVFNMNYDDKTLCKLSTESINSEFVMSSPLMSYPTRGYFGHPQLSDADRDFYVAVIKGWLAK